MQIYTPNHLNDLMSESDYIVVALPHTDKTEKLVNAAAINSMKRTGVLVNIGRGQTVDEEALVKGTICSPVLSLSIWASLVFLILQDRDQVLDRCGQ